jgi:hypothetical protein
MQDQQVPSQNAAERVAKLPEVITHLLKEQGVPVPYAWAAGIHADAMHEEPQIQMFQCARHWTSLLASSQEDTRFARYCLISAHTVKVWLQSFQTLVIPLYLKMLEAKRAPNAAAVSDVNTTCEVVGID